MMYAKTLLVIPLVALSTVVSAETVFRCTVDGRTIFSSQPEGGDCREVNIKVTEPNPEEVARLRRKYAEAAERDQQAAAADSYDLLMRAQEASYSAEARARAAERRLAEQLSRDTQNYYPAYIPAWPPLAVPAYQSAIPSSGYRHGYGGPGGSATVPYFGYPNGSKGLRHYLNGPYGQYSGSPYGSGFGPYGGGPRVPVPGISGTTPLGMSSPAMVESRHFRHR